METGIDPTGISAMHLEERVSSLRPAVSCDICWVLLPSAGHFVEMLSPDWQKSWNLAQKLFLFQPVSTHSPAVICKPVRWFESGLSLLTHSRTCNCLLVPEALTCWGQKSPFPWEEGTRPQTPTRPPAETSPLMTTTPLCCLNVPCWLCKRTWCRGAQRSFTKGRSRVCAGWATCPPRSRGRVLLDQGLAKVIPPVPLIACGLG